jgi:thiamine biosynthesis lipoprotein
VSARLAAWTLALLPLAAWAAPQTQVHYVMGTYLRITADGDGAAAGMAACFREVRRLEHVFSRFDGTSELSRLNAAPSVARPASADMTRLLERARVLADATDGVFDVAVGPLTALWRRPAPPAPAEIAAARAAAGRGAFGVHDGRVALAPGARLDVCADRLRAAGVSRALVSLGESSLYAIGAPEDAAHWRLAVRGPDPETVVGWLGLRDIAASVSATFGSAGRRQGAVAHIIDPRSGRPLADDAVAVVLASSATDAEGWTKALLVWGRDGVGRVRRGGATGAVHATSEAVRADVADDAAASVTWKPLPAPRRIAASEEPLR